MPPRIVLETGPSFSRKIETVPNVTPSSSMTERVVSMPRQQEVKLVGYVVEKQEGMRPPPPPSYNVNLCVNNEDNTKEKYLLKRASSGEHINNGDKGSVQVKRKRVRISFTREQIEQLECAYKRNRYPDVNKKSHLAAEMGFSADKIHNWFNNRRNKDRVKRKRDATDRQELEKETMIKENCDYINSNETATVPMELSSGAPNHDSRSEQRPVAEFIFLKTQELAACAKGFTNTTDYQADRSLFKTTAEQSKTPAVSAISSGKEHCAGYPVPAPSTGNSAVKPTDESLRYSMESMDITDYHGDRNTTADEEASENAPTALDNPSDRLNYERRATPEPATGCFLRETQERESCRADHCENCGAVFLPGTRNCGCRSTSMPAIECCSAATKVPGLSTEGYMDTTERRGGQSNTRARGPNESPPKYVLACSTPNYGYHSVSTTLPEGTNELKTTKECGAAELMTLPEMYPLLQMSRNTAVQAFGKAYGMLSAKFSPKCATQRTEDASPTTSQCEGTDTTSFDDEQNDAERNSTCLSRLEERIGKITACNFNQKLCRLVQVPQSEFSTLGEAAGSFPEFVSATCTDNDSAQLETQAIPWTAKHQGAAEIVEDAENDNVLNDDNESSPEGEICKISAVYTLPKSPETAVSDIIMNNINREWANDATGAKDSDESVTIVELENNPDHTISSQQVDLRSSLTVLNSSAVFSTEINVRGSAFGDPYERNKGILQIPEFALSPPGLIFSGKSSETTPSRGPTFMCPSERDLPSCEGNLPVPECAPQETISYPQKTIGPTESNISHSCEIQVPPCTKTSQGPEFAFTESFLKSTYVKVLRSYAPIQIFPMKTT